MSKQFYIKQISLVKRQFSKLKTVPFQTIQFTMSTQFEYKYSLIVKKHFYFKLFGLVKQFSFKHFSLA